MPSIFTKIINREIPGHIVAENDHFIAFLDIQPLVVGHTLIVPKKEIDYIFDMEDQPLGDMMVFAKKVAKAVKSAVSCKRIGVAVIGLEVPHTHVHLVPMTTVGDISFTQSKMSPSQADLEAVREKIKSFLK